MADDSPEPRAPMMRATCGCQFGTVDSLFFFEPCSMDCELHQFVLREAAAQNKEVTVLDLR